MNLVNMELTLKNIKKSYGKVQALKDFSYTFENGVYGLLGANGAGKTTLMNIITGNLRADSGEMLVNGEKVQTSQKSYRSLLGYMPQQQTLYPDFTLERFLLYIAAAKDIPAKTAVGQVEEMMEKVNLGSEKNVRLKNFSGGMKQRALLAQALLGNPLILLLDEPSAGLDPKERIRMKNLIAELAMDRIIILATHIVQDVEMLADKILIMKDGLLMADGDHERVCENAAGHTFEGVVSVEEYDSIKKNMQISQVRREGEDSISVRIVADEMPHGFTSVKPSIEDVYLYYFKDRAE